MAAGDTLIKYSSDYNFLQVKKLHRPQGPTQQIPSSLAGSSGRLCCRPGATTYPLPTPCARAQLSWLISRMCLALVHSYDAPLVLSSPPLLYFHLLIPYPSPESLQWHSRAVMCWGQLIHTSSQLIIQWLYAGSLTSAIMQVFMSQKLANITYQAFIPPRDPTGKYLPGQHCQKGWSCPTMTHYSKDRQITGQIWTAACFCVYSIVGTQPHPFADTSSADSFTLQWQSSCNRDLWPAKPKRLIIWIFEKKFDNPHSLA